MATITKIRDDGTRRTYRIEGEDIAPEWRDGLREAPWCEVTFYGADRRPASYGGSVWPAAWPSLFAVAPPHRQWVELTEAGAALVAEAR
jgi:hypothetical protein